VAILLARRLSEMDSARIDREISPDLLGLGDWIARFPEATALLAQLPKA
jgi:hypothetical protein